MIIQEEEKESIFWVKSMEFIEKNLKAIQGRARKFLPYSGGAYSLNDFIQEAYLCAMDAAIQCKLKCRTCEDKISECETYLRLFWGILKNRYCKMADIPSYEKLLGKGASKMPVKMIDIKNIDSSVLIVESSNDEIMPDESVIEEKINSSLSVMNAQSKKVWKYYLGRNGCGRALNRNEIAKKMGFMHPQRVSQLINRGLKEVREAFCIVE